MRCRESESLHARARVDHIRVGELSRSGASRKVRATSSDEAWAVSAELIAVPAVGVGLGEHLVKLEGLRKVIAGGVPA